MSFMRKINTVVDNVIATRPALGKYAHRVDKAKSLKKEKKNKSKANQRDIKCVVVGDGGVGKTSMLLAYTTGTFLTDYTPTVFDTFAVTMEVGDIHCNLGLYDTAGQETYDNLRSLVYYDTDVFIVCFSVVRPDSFDNVRTRWIPELKLYRPKCHVVLVGTQIDLREEQLLGADTSTLSSFGKHLSDSMLSLQTNHNYLPSCITKRHGVRLASKVGAEGYYECSALTHDGLAEVFEKTVETLLKPKKYVQLWREFKAFVKKTNLTRSDA